MNKRSKKKIFGTAKIGHFSLQTAKSIVVLHILVQDDAIKPAKLRQFLKKPRDNIRNNIKLQKVREFSHIRTALAHEKKSFLHAARR